MSYRTQAQHYHAQPYQADHHDDRHDDRHDGRQSEPRGYDHHHPFDDRQDHRQESRQETRQETRHDHRSQDNDAYYRDAPPPRPSRAERVAQTKRPAPSADYTLGHGRRQVRVGPVAFWTIFGTLVIMACWSVVTATYFAFHDDVLTRLIARQAQMQFAY